MKYLGNLLCILLTLGNSYAQFSENKDSFKKFEGYFDFYYDDKTDKIYLEIPVRQLENEFLYVYALSSGIGSNDIGMDRGQLGNEQVVFFQRAGNKLLLIQPNLKFRALTNNVLEQKSVEQAFAKSILAGFAIEEEKNGQLIIDITEFLLRDAHGVAQRLKKTDQGSYTLDKTKSALALARTKAFPENVEFDATLTFSGEPKGDHIKSVTPNASLVTVSQHHSFIKLPDNNFELREFDTRSGSFVFSFYDYASRVEEPLKKRYIMRHRLKKKNPEALVSEAVEPIIYYLDNGTPEPVRSALLEGAKWWDQAFEAIGFRNAFQVKLLPDDVDPLDVRYNVIQWIHRSTRGWSYGSSISDPRTGEIIKGHVSLGSLRIRQDFLIAQALMNRPFAKNDGNNDPMLQLALARIRQLSAHEIGHTLGFSHNFAASAKNRSSVMDYPHPLLEIKGNTVDFSNAYATGIGEWDKISVAYSYSQFVDGENKKEALNTILEKGINEGQLFITDQDARPRGGAHHFAHLWDNGNAIGDELLGMLKLRKVAIENFSIDNIRTNEPYSVLEDIFVPLYFYHRYQTEAATKIIGGLDYTYAVKGDGQLAVKEIDPKIQKQTLQAILTTLTAEELAIPKEKLSLFPPRAFGYEKTRESFNGVTGVSFDALSIPETAADMTLSLLLHPERASRLIQQKSINPANIGLAEVLDEIVHSTMGNTFTDPYLYEVQNKINFRVLYYLMNLASHTGVHPQVNAIANAKLKSIRAKFSVAGSEIYEEIVRRIDWFNGHHEDFKPIEAPKIPDGSPIGMDCMD